MAERAIATRRRPGADRAAGGYALPEDCSPRTARCSTSKRCEAEVAQTPSLRDVLWGGFAADPPIFGIYGKLGDNKGSFALLAAMHRLKAAGLDCRPRRARAWPPGGRARFRERARELGLTDRVLQIPFLPHWRVPEFLRGCLAVCCLEQDFPIGFTARSCRSKCCCAAHASSAPPRSFASFRAATDCRMATVAWQSLTSTISRP